MKTIETPETGHGFKVGDPVTYTRQKGWSGVVTGFTIDRVRVDFGEHNLDFGNGKEPGLYWPTNLLVIRYSDNAAEVERLKGCDHLISSAVERVQEASFKALTAKNAALKEEVEKVNRFRERAYHQLDDLRADLTAARARIAELEGYKSFVDELRRWLKEGATVKATDPSNEVLMFHEDGSLHGGMTVTGASTGTLMRTAIDSALSTQAPEK